MKITQFFRYADGKNEAIETPGWYVNDDGDMIAAAHRAGWKKLHPYEHGDEIDILRNDRNQFLVGFWIAGEVVAFFEIPSPADFVIFQATVIAPTVQMLIASYEHELRERDRQASAKAGLRRAG